MLDFLKLAKTALISNDYEIKENKLIYKNKEFILKDKLNNYENTYFVVAFKNVILFKNKYEDNFKSAKNRQKLAIFIMFILMSCSIFALIYFDFNTLSCVISIVFIVLFVLSILNYSFLKQQIKALEIILSKI